MRSSENGQKLAECTAEEIAEKEVNCTPQSRKTKNVKCENPCSQACLDGLATGADCQNDAGEDCERNL